MRDNFSAKTRRMLAARVGFHCSNPSCKNSTSGPALEEDLSVDIGVAAHITAAETGGKRYDENMSSAERSNGLNGIWLCQSCSKLIDSDESRYTTPVLHQWKKEAVHRAQSSIAGGRALGLIRPTAALDTADEDFLRGLDLPTVDAIDAVSARLRAATQIDIQAFRAARGRPQRTLALTLRLQKSGTPSVTLENAARLTALAEPISVLAPGGTGKSTTLIQAAECLVAEDGPIPVLVPLGEWSDRQEDFFDSILRRNAFGTFRRQHLMQLAYYGRLVLLLDGWNELTPEARLRATNDFFALQRDYPQLAFVISSRRPALPDAGLVIEIEALSLDQQMELARAVRGQEGADLLDRAWRTEGLRELVRIPLYLNALLALPAGAAFPETKQAVLRVFVEHNESAPGRIERLRRDTVGQHTAMLVGLAVEATQSANTVVSDTIANRTVSRVVRVLADDGQIQIGAAPQPRDIVDGLVSAHLLVRAAGADGPIRFQHQLFQEWYAAAEVETLMVRAAAGDADARRRLREEILNWPNWEESILFACDRLSRSDDNGVRAVAGAIEDALSIDPLLAAAMLDRAADPVWVRVRERVMRFVCRWHAAGTFDRAVCFMITSGKPEFAEFVWPLASSADDQIQFETFRAVAPFRPGVLGADREARLRALPAPQRKLALAEIASNSGADGMHLAATLATGDPDPEVVVGVVESLAFRRGDRLVNQIMQAASDAAWQALGRENYPYHLTDGALDGRLAREREVARTAEPEPLRLLNRIADDGPADAEARITHLLGTADIQSRDMDFDRTIAHTYPAYPAAVAGGLVARITAGLSLPYRAGDYLKDAPLFDAGPVTVVALDPATPERRLDAAAAVLGPETVGALFDQLIAIVEQSHSLGRYDEQLSNAERRLVSALTKTRESVFVSVLLAKGQTNDPKHIGLMADLLARYGSDSDKHQIDAVNRAGLRGLAERWMSTLREAQQPERYVASEVARAVGRLADAALAEPLRLLLERDLGDYATARAAHLAARGQGQHNDMGYTLLYSSAFAAMHDAPAVAVLTQHLGDIRWGREAAGALYDIWLKDHPLEDRRPFGGLTNFSQHMLHRDARAAGTPPTSDFAEAIFAIVRTMGNPARAAEEQQHAIALAVIGLGLPHGAKRPEIDALLALPQPITHKQRLLVAAARAGETIPAALLMDGLRNLLAEAETQTWRLESNRGELMGWIELYPFSDAPERVHDAIALLPAQCRSPHALQRLLETLPQGPADVALTILQRLAADDLAFLQLFEWMNALVKLNSETAALALLDHLCAGRIPVRDGFRLSRALVEWANAHASVRTEIIARYRRLPATNIRRVLEMAMNELTDEDVFMALFNGHVDTPNPIHGVTYAIRNLAIGRKPSEEWVGAFEEFGLPLNGLRASLFAMLPAHDARARLAKECLVLIDELRDERGHINNEPRHPDIATGRAWPPESEEPSEQAR